MERRGGKEGGYSFHPMMNVNLHCAQNCARQEQTRANSRQLLPTFRITGIVTRFCIYLILMDVRRRSDFVVVPFKSGVGG